MTTEQKSLPMAEPTYITGYSHPPRLKEGARKAIVIRNIICESDGRILLKKGTTGLVIPLRAQNLYVLFEKHANWLFKGFLWNHFPHFGAARLDQTYDFFHHFTKDGKTSVGTWHTYISFFDFEYMD